MVRTVYRRVPDSDGRCNPSVYIRVRCLEGA
jgi:hypothetical protein